MEGAGVRVRRLIGTHILEDLDPFLLLDEFKSADEADYIAGFPNHPHRGFETVTAIFRGQSRHFDSMGNEGLLMPGSIQWMTAGSGIIHSEMPEKTPAGIWGYQLWINLPKVHKMTKPRYQDIPAGKIQEINFMGSTVRIFAGNLAGVTGPAETLIPVMLLDVAIPAHSEIRIPVPEGWNGFLYVCTGSIVIPGSKSKTEVRAGSLGVLGPAGSLAINTGAAGARVLLASAEPLNEPVVKYGPFVMNTLGEIKQAIEDFQSGILDKTV